MITIEIDDRDIQTALRRLQRQVGDLTPTMGAFPQQNAAASLWASRKIDMPGRGFSGFS